jgi:hypothetical protein
MQALARSSPALFRDALTILILRTDIALSELLGKLVQLCKSVRFAIADSAHLSGLYQRSYDILTGFRVLNPRLMRSIQTAEIQRPPSVKGAAERELGFWQRTVWFKQDLELSVVNEIQDERRAKRRRHPTYDGLAF